MGYGALHLKMDEEAEGKFRTLSMWLKCIEPPCLIRLIFQIRKLYRTVWTENSRTRQTLGTWIKACYPTPRVWNGIDAWR